MSTTKAKQSKDTSSMICDLYFVLEKKIIDNCFRIPHFFIQSLAKTDRVETSKGGD